MKTIKKIIRWFLDLFISKDKIAERRLNEMKDLVDKMESSRTNKQKRDWFLKSKGYSNVFSKEQKDKQKLNKVLKSKRIKLSSYQSQVKRFSELKRKNKIEIY